MGIAKKYSLQKSKNFLFSPKDSEAKFPIKPERSH